MTKAELKDADSDLEDRLKARLASLREEYRAGNAQLQTLEARETELRQTLLRIAGAIQELGQALGDAAGK